MGENKKVAVIIPFYKDKLSDHEKIGLQQCFKILVGHTIIAVKPESMVLPNGVTKYPFFDTVSFNDEYFKSVQGYNRLMLDDAFYRQFLAYEYILIYQLDAFVFKDELDHWCSRKFDYIGAPWIKPNPYPDIVKALKSKIQNYIYRRYNIQENGLPIDKQFEYKVGNGGFSLRKTKKFHDICVSFREKIAFYNSHDSHLFNEDIFWSIEVNRKRNILNIPKYKTALKFSFEFNPERALITNSNQLPFGCHAWDLNIDFWRPVFKEYGYVV